MFKKATKSGTKARIALVGPSGSGKTYSALSIAQGLGKSVAFIDTERGSASKYSNDFDFDVVELDNFHPTRFVECIRGASQAGYDVLIIDSMSHEWSGRGGCLYLVDQKGGNSFTAWKSVTPLHDAFIDAIICAPLHIICTMRAKMAYSIDSVRGKSVPKKVGMGAIQRSGVDYEFDIVGELSASNVMHITKTRCSSLNDQMFTKPDRGFGAAVLEWLSDAAPRAEPIDVPTPDVVAEAVKLPDEPPEWVDAAKPERKRSPKSEYIQVMKIWKLSAEDSGLDAAGVKNQIQRNIVMELAHQIDSDKIESRRLIEAELGCVVERSESGDLVNAWRKIREKLS